MRMGVFVALMYIVDAIYKLAKYDYDLSGTEGFLGFIFCVCLTQDLISIFNGGK